MSSMSKRLKPTNILMNIIVRLRDKSIVTVESIEVERRQSDYLLEDNPHNTLGNRYLDMSVSRLIVVPSRKPHIVETVDQNDY